MEELNSIPLGGLLITALSREGPLFVTVIVKTTLPDGVVWVIGAIDSSADGMVVVVAGSVVVVDVVVVGAGAALPTSSRIVVPGSTDSVVGMLWEMTMPSWAAPKARLSRPTRSAPCSPPTSSGEATRPQRGVPPRTTVTQRATHR